MNTWLKRGAELSTTTWWWVWSSGGEEVGQTWKTQTYCESLLEMSVQALCQESLVPWNSWNSWWVPIGQNNCLLDCPGGKKGKSGKSKVRPWRRTIRQLQKRNSNLIHQCLRRGNLCYDTVWVGSGWSQLQVLSNSARNISRSFSILLTHLLFRRLSCTHPSSKLMSMSHFANYWWKRLDGMRYTPNTSSLWILWVCLGWHASAPFHIFFWRRKLLIVFSILWEDEERLQAQFFLVSFINTNTRINHY